MADFKENDQAQIHVKRLALVYMLFVGKSRLWVAQQEIFIVDLGNYVIHFQCHLIPGPKEIIANFNPQKKRR